MTNSARLFRVLAITLAISILIGSTPQFVFAQEPQSRWAPAIRAFEEADAEKGELPKFGVVFVGSSSIRMWDLDTFMPGLPALNRGFGGSQIADSVEYAHRIVTKYEPRTVVFYAGDNDIAAGKTPETVIEDYKKFVAKVREKLPDTRIVFISIKPSIARWELVDKMREANRLIEKYSAGDDKLLYLDVDTPMIGADGKPKEDLFLDDGLHLNEKGYALWTKHLTPLLKNEGSGKKF